MKESEDYHPMAGFQIKAGFFGDTRLDGLRAVAVMWWPAALHLGNHGIVRGAAA